MRISSLAFVLLLSCVPSGQIAFAQRQKININTETPEGQLLQQIGQESDESKKLALLEEFASKYPKNENIGWVYGQLQPAYLKANQPDKVLDVGEKLLAIDPDDLETALQSLKAAETRKDPELIKRWSNQTSQIAKKVIASAQPKEEDEVEAWKKHVDYAKQVDTYTEYALHAAALQTTDPRKKIDLIETLRQRNPKSQYLAQLTPLEFMAYRQTGENDKAIAIAEKILATDQSNEDMLLVVADSYLQKKREPEKVLAYSAKLVEVMNSKPKPEGVSDADWENRKNTIVGIGHYMSGKLYFTQNKFAQADKSLRAALPLLESNKDLKPEVLFLLGLANYKMEKIPDAMKFNQLCAAIKSPYQGQAAKNLAAMRSQYRAVK